MIVDLDLSLLDVPRFCNSFAKYSFGDSRFGLESLRCTSFLKEPCKKKGISLPKEKGTSREWNAPGLKDN